MNKKRCALVNSEEQDSKVDTINKCNAGKQGSSPSRHERAEKEAIVTVFAKHNQATAAWKQEMSITEKCSNAEKCTALFAEKIGVWNTQSPQGSVGIHRSASTYAYKRMKDVQYRSYMYWKVTGITNPEFLDFMVKPAWVLDLGKKTNLSLEKGGNKFEINLFRKKKLVTYNF
eukprot:188109-Ditylum_brightwellii.AAC.1